MSDEKPKRKTNTSSTVKQRYNKKTYDRIILDVRKDKGEKETIQAHAISRNETLSGFVKRAIAETMERDNQAPKQGCNQTNQTNHLGERGHHEET